MFDTDRKITESNKELGQYIYAISKQDLDHSIDSNRQEYHKEDIFDGWKKRMENCTVQNIVKTEFVSEKLAEEQDIEQYIEENEDNKETYNHEIGEQSHFKD